MAPAGAVLAVANPGDEPARMGGTTRAGLGAKPADGSILTPPWAT
ncbi:hypothetical protein [Streptomyces lydicamycinicus]|nr:hypothetical protein [Streptomyces lydicamycinicus]